MCRVTLNIVSLKLSTYFCIFSSSFSSSSFDYLPLPSSCESSSFHPPFFLHQSSYYHSFFHPSVRLFVFLSIQHPLLCFVHFSERALFKFASSHFQNYLVILSFLSLWCITSYRSIWITTLPFKQCNSSRLVVIFPYIRNIWGVC